MDMSTMDGLAARFRKRAFKANAAQRTNATPSDAESLAREASGVGPISTPRPARQSEAVARAVLEALSAHDPL